MNPSPYQMSVIASRTAVERQRQEASRAEHHKKAVARRRKAKRGGKR